MNCWPPSFSRSSWLILFGASVFLVVVYGLLGFLLTHGVHPRRTDPSLAVARPILIALGVGALMGAVKSLHNRIDGKIGGEDDKPALSPGEFQTYSLMVLIMSGSCTLCGLLLLLLGGSTTEFAAFGGGILFVDFAFVLPRGLQFWGAYEKTSASPPQLDTL